MKTTPIIIDSDILNKYPKVAIGYMVVDNLHHIASARFSDEIVSISKKGITENNLTLQNLVEFSSISAWRQLYQDCGVKPKAFKSSVESLLRRFLQNEYRPIIPIVDLYNFISSGYILSLGGYNWEAIIGTLTLRYGKETDNFIPLNGKENISVTKDHIVYADESADDPVICWQWNQKDSKRTMLNNEVKRGLFIFDTLLESDRDRLTSAMANLEGILHGYDINILTSGILDKDHPSLLL
jgi:DNA/RNA-binding domain of Phe-tRNA-synthetase-like protein